MSKNPFKIVLKLPKPAQDQAPVDSKAQKPKKKRKHSSLVEPANAETKHPRLAPEAGAPAAQRDHFGEAKRQKTEPKLADRSPSGNVASDSKPEAVSKPRFVIKGSFAKPKDASPKPAVPPGVHHAGVHKVQDDSLRKEKKKKKKKHKERPAAEQTQEPPIVKPEPVQAAPEKKIIIKPPAKQPPAGKALLNNAPARSQAVSTRTNASLDAGHTATSNLTGPANNSTMSRPESTVAGQEASSSGQGILVPTGNDIERLINRLQKKDPFHIFKDPVTDAMAPGYSAMIKRPMSFTQMRQRLEKGEYTSWDPVQQDLEAIFNNAMVYNGPTTPYHQKAREMMVISRKFLTSLKTVGRIDGRGNVSKTGSKPGPKPGAKAAAKAAAKTDNTAVLPAHILPLTEKRTERRTPVVRAPDRPPKPKGETKKKAAARKAAARAAASGILARPTTYDAYGGDPGPLSADENTRATYAQIMGTALEQQWKGLGKGASAAGAVLAAGPLTLRANFTGNVSMEAYAKSLRAFGSRLMGSARSQLEKRLGSLTGQASKLSVPNQLQPGSQQHGQWKSPLEPGSQSVIPGTYMNGSSQQPALKKEAPSAPATSYPHNPSTAGTNVSSLGNGLRNAAVPGSAQSPWQ